MFFSFCNLVTRQIMPDTQYSVLSEQASVRVQVIRGGRTMLSRQRFRDEQEAWEWIASVRQWATATPTNLQRDIAPDLGVPTSPTADTVLL